MGAAAQVGTARRAEPESDHVDRERSGGDQVALSSPAESGEPREEVTIAFATELQLHSEGKAVIIATI